MTKSYSPEYGRVIISSVIPLELHARIKSYCLENHISASSFIKNLLKEKLGMYEIPKQKVNKMEQLLNENGHSLD